MDTVADRLFQAWKSYEGRTKQGVTQTALAEMVGEVQPTVSKWLDGTRTPTIEQVATIAKALRVSAGWLAFGEGVMLGGYHDPPRVMPPGERLKSRKAQ